MGSTYWHAGQPECFLHTSRREVGEVEDARCRDRRRATYRYGIHTVLVRSSSSGRNDRYLNRRYYCLDEFQVVTLHRSISID